MATFVKTSAHTWKAVIRRLGWPTACRTFRLKRDATLWAHRTEDEMARGVFTYFPNARRMSFSEAMDRYLDEVSPDKSMATRVTEAGRARPLRAFFGRYALSAITPDLVARYRDLRLATPRYIEAPQRRPAAMLASGTVRLELALLSHLFTIAIREWRLGLMINPVACIRRPSAGPGRTRRLQANEEGKLTIATQAYCNPMLGWIFRIALETGMRLGEIRGLNLQDVDIVRRVVHLRQTKNRLERTVPLSQTATEAFSAALRNPERPLGCTLVFFGQRHADNHYGRYGVRTAWMTVRHKLGLDDLRFHDLRHEAVSRLVEAGLSDQEVAAISGHKSMQMLRRYTHLRAEDLVYRLDHCRPRMQRRRFSRAVLPV